LKHVIIMPAHNEAEHIGTTLASLLAQTLPPDRIIVVDDGSSDGTAAIVREMARAHATIAIVEGPPTTERRYRVVEVFNRGYALIRNDPCAYVSKIDADLVFPPDYFRRLFEVMDADPGIGAAGGTLCDLIGGKPTPIRIPETHVPGPLKTIRRSVFDAMGGFVPTLGWDIIDTVKIRMMGYRTLNLPELQVTHLRRHGSATGIVRGNIRMGHGAYVIGTHPLFALARSFYRMLEPPYVIGGLALGYGYFKSWSLRTPQIQDPALIAALRAEQLHRLLHRNKLPRPLLAAKRGSASG
jgi:glycosyltransferase involved in cell wall biosynthesis